MKELELNVIGTVFYGMVPIVGDIVLAQPAGMYGEDMEGIGEPEETMQMLMQRFSFLETA